jgi:peptide/nickel transport system substrate-binding protein
VLAASIAVMVGSATGGTTQELAADPGTLRLALGAIGTEALDPLRGPNNNGVYLRLMFDPLVGVNRAGTAISKATGVAQDWSVSKDGRTYTFTIRKGIKFQNGTDLTSEDVVFSLKRLGTTSDLTTTGRTIANQVASIRTLGKYRVQMRLKVPTATLLYRLSPLVDVAGLIVSKSYFERVGQTGFDQQPMGSGPYRLVSRQLGASMTFESTGKHWLVGTPKFKRVTIQIVPEENSRVSLFRSGQVDFIDVGIQQQSTLKNAGGARIFKHASINPLLLFFNLGNKDSPLRDVNVRKALSLAINRQQLNQFLFQNQGTLTGNVFPSQLGAAQLPADKYDLAEAKRLLGLTKYKPGGEKLTVELNAQVRAAVPQMLEVAQTIQSYWRAIGVDSNIVYGDYGTWRAKAVGRTLAPNAAQLLDIGGRPDNSDTAVVWFSCGGLLSQACDRQMDKIAARWSGSQGANAYRIEGRRAQNYIHRKNFALSILGLPVYFVGDEKVRSDYSPGSIALGFHTVGLVLR